MKTYTPEQALKVVRYRIALHDAVSVIFGFGAFCGLVGVIGFAEAESAFLSLGVSMTVMVACAFLSVAEGVSSQHWQSIEQDMIGRHGDSGND